MAFLFLLLLFYCMEFETKLVSSFRLFEYFDEEGQFK